MSDRSQITDALIRRASIRPSKRPFRIRFHLSTMFLVVTGICAISAVAHYLGFAYVEQVMEQARLNNSGVPFMPAMEIVTIPLFLCGLFLGTLIVWSAVRLSEKRAFLLFAILSIACLLLWIVALNVPSKPLSDTKAKDLKAVQIVKLALFLVGGVAPVSAFIGWRCGVGTDRA